MHALHKSTARKSLKPRREPYWGPPLARGQFIGFRKIDALRGSWIARMRDESGSQKYRSLGPVTDAFGYDEARAAAMQWFKTWETGVTDEVVTVEDAARAYVIDRRREKGEATAHDADMRFLRTVYDTPFGRRALAKLRSEHVKNWRENIGLAPDNSNRTLTTLRAALNLAVASRQVSAGQAIEWNSIKPVNGGGKRRELFLDRDQRRRLLAACEGAIRDLVEAATLTGARAGELVSATRNQFDARTGSMKFTGKTGTRLVPLSPSAVALFTRLSKSKLPTARLFVRDNGSPWRHTDDWSRAVRAAAIRAKLPSGVCLYSLRHSFITEAISGGMDVLQTARLCGTSIGQIQKHYGHFANNAARQHLARLEML